MRDCLILGHQKGISQIEVDAVQLPTADNGHFAVCKATVVSKTGESFTDIGDANPAIATPKSQSTHLRIAIDQCHSKSTSQLHQHRDDLPGRIIDLSDLTGNGSEAQAPESRSSPTNDPGPILRPKNLIQPLLHLPARSLTTGNGGNGTKSSKKPTEPKEPTHQEPNPEQTKTQSPSVPTMSEAQKRAIYNLSRRRGISVEDLGKMALESYGVELDASVQQGRQQLYSQSAAGRLVPTETNPDKMAVGRTCLAGEGGIPIALSFQKLAAYCKFGP